MSAIDSVNNVDIGRLGGNIEVYWPLKSGHSTIGKVSESNTDFDKEKLTPYITFFGGGSGEHPAMPILNDAAALKYLIFSDLFKDCEEIDDIKLRYEADHKKGYRERSENLEKFLYLFDDMIEIGSETKKELWDYEFNKNYWPVLTYIDFQEDFEKIELSDPIIFERTMLYVFGSVIVNHMPIEAIKDTEIKELVSLFNDLKNTELLEYMNIEYKNKLDSFFEDHKDDNYSGVNLDIQGTDINTGYSLKEWRRDFIKN